MVDKQAFIAVWKLESSIGQVPQIGSLLSDNPELRLKSIGSEAIFVTHQSDISWLKEVAPSNIETIVVTLLTIQSPMSWLKEVAPSNIETIVVTLLTFHPLISPLKSVLSLNALLISVTWLTLQSGIAPYSDEVHIPSAGLVVKQAFIAVWKLESVTGQVPQTGLLLSENEEGVKPPGSEAILVTHQLDISWLKDEL